MRGIISGRLRVVGLAAVLFGLLAAPLAAADKAPKVLVLGVDGLDPVLLERFVAEGVLPNFARLIAEGEFSTLETSMPPLSPIAWSNFATGQDPGGHGIYDFVHRDPETTQPYLSMAKVESPKRTAAIGSWEIPLSGSTVENLRKGRAFWEILGEHGIPTTIFRMPANFPPVETPHGKSFSGMGTPDILGSPGTFTFYSDRPVPNAKDITGGEVRIVGVVDDKVEAQLIGPENSFRRVPKTSGSRRSRSGERVVEYKHPDTTVDFTAYVDPDEPLVKFVVQDNEFILAEGEWSDWISVDFKLIPMLASVSAACRFYLKQVRPDFELYVTPLQISPATPALPISTPESWSRELFDDLGYFYTQELPEDTKAYVGGIFTAREFWQQSQLVFSERRRALDYFLDRFDEGFLFFYFSSIDQGSHMLWHFGEPEHPAHVKDEFMENAIRTLYQQLDDSLGRVVASIDDETTLIVMSDHGFGSFDRQVNLNSWLLENGYVTLRNPALRGKYPLFVNVDWTRTRAYAVGLNGLYINTKGREKRGIVEPGAEYDALLAELEQKLLEMRDPDNGERAVTLVTVPRRDFHGPYTETGPDLIVGYNRGYRTSWSSPLGEFPLGVFIDNAEPWSGDHGVDYRHVPGVLISNRPITLDQPSLLDLTVTILDEYGIAAPEEMLGEDCLGDRP